MPRKIRELRADLRRSGMVVAKGRGRCDHEVWIHPSLPGFTLVLDDKDGDDAAPYKESDVRKALARIRRAGL
jgi:hypothetical protein